VFLDRQTSSSDAESRQQANAFHRTPTGAIEIGLIKQIKTKSEML
jgi:hypothetical protein